jgi:hypothetical protein
MYPMLARCGLASTIPLSLHGAPNQTMRLREC